jgi:hypothetical protein
MRTGTRVPSSKKKISVMRSCAASGTLTRPRTWAASYQGRWTRITTRQEDFTTDQVARLNGWLKVDTIQNKTAANSRYSGYASIYFSDENADGRLDSSAVCRAGGKVDAVRLPKEAYYAFRVAGNTQPDIHIIGHWTYPAGTKKTMYVVANNVSSVGLSVNGGAETKSSTPTDGYTFSFPNITWATGSIKAVGYDSSGKEVCSHELKTAGPAAAVKLTTYTAPWRFPG